MLCEAALCTPWKGVSVCDAHAHSIDLWPHDGQTSHGHRMGVVGRALDEDFTLLAGHVPRPSLGLDVGPDHLFGFSPGRDAESGIERILGEAVNMCLSDPDDCELGPCSLMTLLVLEEQVRTLLSPPRTFVISSASGAAPLPPHMTVLG